MTTYRNSSNVNTSVADGSPLPVKGRTKTITATPTITAGAYAANDAVGGELTFTDALRESGGSGVILDVVITDKAKQNAALKLVLFSQTFTETADNAAMTVTDADLVSCLGVIDIAAGDYDDFADNSVATVTGVNLGVVASGSANLFGQLYTTGTPTYVSTSDLQVRLVVLQD